MVLYKTTRHLYLLVGKVSGQAPAGLYVMCFVEVKLGLVSYASRLDIESLTSRGLGQIPNSTAPLLRDPKLLECSNNI